MGGRKRATLGELPSFLLVHVNTQTGGATQLPAEPNVHVSGAELDRFAVVHHIGEAPMSGHYTATVTASGKLAYICDDCTITHQPGAYANAWQRAYLIFLRSSLALGVRPSCDDKHLAASCTQEKDCSYAGRCGKEKR